LYLDLLFLRRLDYHVSRQLSAISFQLWLLCLKSLRVFLFSYAVKFSRCGFSRRSSASCRLYFMTSYALRRTTYFKNLLGRPSFPIHQYFCP